MPNKEKQASADAYEKRNAAFYASLVAARQAEHDTDDRLRRGGGERLQRQGAGHVRANRAAPAAESTMKHFRIKLSLGDGAPLPGEFRLFTAGWNDTENGRFLFDEKAAALVMCCIPGVGCRSDDRP